MNTSSSATPVISVRSNVSIVNALRPRLISTLCFASLVVIVASLTAPHVSAAPPPVSIAQPVQVEVVKPVDVRGAVETLNDALYQPYFQTKAILANGTTALEFTVPAGKRLVIETVTVQALVDLGQKTVVFLNGRFLGGEFFELYLSVQSQGAFGGGECLVGTHPIKLRVDGATDPTQPTFRIISSSNSQQTFKASVTGYLVDL